MSNKKMSFSILIATACVMLLFPMIIVLNNAYPMSYFLFYIANTLFSYRAGAMIAEDIEGLWLSLLDVPVLFIVGFMLMLRPSGANCFVLAALYLIIELVSMVVTKRLREKKGEE